MEGIKWKKPIEISFRSGDTVIVDGPTAALICMEEKWPYEHGLVFISARSLCRAAICGRKSPEAARRMFVRAASEAKLGVH